MNNSPTSLLVMLRAREGEDLADLLPFAQPGAQVAIGRGVAVISQAIGCGANLDATITPFVAALRRSCATTDDDLGIDPEQLLSSKSAPEATLPPLEEHLAQVEALGAALRADRPASVTLPVVPERLYIVLDRLPSMPDDVWQELNAAIDELLAAIAVQPASVAVPDGYGQLLADARQAMAVHWKPKSLNAMDTRARIIERIDAILTAAPAVQPADPLGLAPLAGQFNEAPAEALRPQAEFGDAYQGAREDLAIWKRRALEAEEAVRQKDQIIDHLTLEAQGETRMGEPYIPEEGQEMRGAGPGADLLLVLERLVREVIQREAVCGGIIARAVAEGRP